ncbi:unnamed protein product [Zymoseptoria tritici ST99CH_1A5]|uniref:Uncharacterized protein n=4 Tax=Zymoseptoria tritici TaxID=1047171 RepID=F9XKB5_ZYMTI|nr:uncharacterized protein MYCGRDRAFT_110767 [Zymoseptoria tritici IPO323]SMQ54097.1 unnamed protein product [Zymoseptoria tritici ST99CH_3D7]SMR58532.1 unnamed protein product [Zymoseptoria tritici ST99CH_1E4]SMR61524.1 unnamed protein product [Zymoseptoria tritici ST99CH_3D1]SMY27732.1 unnamed protein product [Zymoseptoria tritici ST99CH_1A5]EGP84672.1 hypothetical protein MYCGRDRAFT_110767 [Zymoseptoria tritici IPO323]
MVLEEATTPEAPFSDSSTPDDDNDLYSGDRSPTYLETRSPTRWPITRPGLEPIYINLDQLPKAFLISGENSAYNKIIGDGTQKYCDETIKLLNRPLREDEATAAAYHLAKTMRIASYGPPLGILAAAFIWRRGKAKFRFPGWTPGEKFNPDRFAGGLLKGKPARFAWHFLRINAYGVVGSFAGQVFFGSYAITVGNVGRFQDPRLKDVTEALKARLEANRAAGKLPGGREVDQTAGKRDGETFDMARQRQRVQEQTRRTAGQQQAQRQKPVADDMSPTGGSFSDDFMNEGAASDGGMLSDSQIQSLQSQQQKREERSEAQTEAARARPVQPNTTTPSTPSRSEPPTKQSGSAWERLRQQAAPAGGQQGQSSPSRPGQSIDNRSGGGDAFSFSSQEEDRQLAKSEAQREFDARLERERAGRNFDERGGGGGGKRW